MGGGYNLVKIKRLDESQHALGLTELAGHSLLPHLASPLQQAEAETCLRPGAELSCGSAGQSRISTLTVGCGAPGPGGTPGSGTDWNYFFFIFRSGENDTRGSLEGLSGLILPHGHNHRRESFLYR